MRELTFSEPILDLRIFKHGVFVVANLLAVSMSFVLFGTVLPSPLFLQELMGYSASKAGLVLAPRGVGAMVSMLLMGNCRAQESTRGR
jgi:DHA2 family multidrug resistance protein